jgi:hypothetical protein
MNFLNKFFKRNNPSEEDRLLVSLKNYSDALRPTESHWANVLEKFHNEASSELVNETLISSKYQLVREIEKLFGGMGSLNDINLPKECQLLHKQLFSAIQNVLRIYWRALGRESNHNQITPFPIGAEVRLIPGKVRCFERNEMPVVIAESSAIRGQIWRVVRYERLDITNMPLYLVQRENTFMEARHNSLALVKENVD